MLCDRHFLATWLNAIVRNKTRWTRQIVTRALLRLIALRKLFEVRRRDIFLNIYPEENVNAYQAGNLFKRHIFLEFGGINGDELIYPRTADIYLQDRQTIRIDVAQTMKKIATLDECDVHGQSELISWYEEEVLSALDTVPKKRL